MKATRALTAEQQAAVNEVKQQWAALDLAVADFAQSEFARFYPADIALQQQESMEEIDQWYRALEERARKKRALAHYGAMLRELQQQQQPK